MSPSDVALLRARRGEDTGCCSRMRVSAAVMFVSKSPMQQERWLSSELCRDDRCRKSPSEAAQLVVAADVALGRATRFLGTTQQNASRSPDPKQ